MQKVLKQLSNQRGAMFGLDARLALMIFTVLTGVLGYFAYGKLKLVRESALIKELTAVDFALRSYQTDMGTFIPFTVDATTEKDEVRNDISILWSQKKVLPKFESLWNGPYVDFSIAKHPLYGIYSLTYLSDNMTPCTNYTNCYVFISISDVPENVWESVNAHFDEARGSHPEGATDAHLLGKVRAEKISDPRTLYFKSVSRQKENK